MDPTDDSASWDLVPDPTSDPHTGLHEDTSFADLIAELQKPGASHDSRKAVAVQWLVRHAYYCANHTVLHDAGAVDALQHVLETIDDLDTKLYVLVGLAVLDDAGSDDNPPTVDQHNKLRGEISRARRALVRDPTPADFARLFAAMDARATTDDRVVALETLFCLAVVHPSAPELRDFVPRVVYQLRCRRSPVGAAAALAVTRLAEHNTALLVEHGAVALLVELLATGDRHHKERAPEALSALLTLSGDKDIADIVVAAGAIKPLVELVRSGVGEQRANAAVVLADLAASNADHQSAIGDAGAVQPLVDLARDGVGQEKCSAIFTIYAIGEGHDANRQRLIAAGVHTVIVEVLRSTTHTHRSCAAHALAGLVRGNRTIQSAFGRAGVFEPLLELLRSGSDEEKEAAATAIADLVAKHDTNKTVADVVPLLLAVMRDGSCEATAAKTLGSLAQKSALSKLRIVQAGALAPLVEILREGDNDAKREAANALRCIAKNNESYAVEMALLGALEALVANLSASTARGDEQGVWAVLRALRWLTECRTNQDALLALGVRDVLNDAEALGSQSATLVARVRNNLNVGGGRTDSETCQIM